MLAFPQRIPCVTTLLCCITLCGGVLPNTVFSQSSQNESERKSTTIRIELQSNARSPSRIVTIEDIARVTGEPEWLRRRIERTDVTSLRSGSGQMETVSANQVQIRLILAGIATHAFTITGNKSRVTLGVTRKPMVRQDKPISRTAVIPQPPLTRTPITKPNEPEKPNQVKLEETVRKLARDELVAQLSLPPDDIELRFTQPLLIRSEFANSPRLKVYLPPKPRPGALSITLAFLDDRDKLLGSSRVAIEFNQLITVPVAAKRISVGQPFDLTNVRLERRRVQNGIDPADAAAIAGQQAKRSIGPGATIRMSDIRTTRQPTGRQATVAKKKTPDPYLVRTRDTVELVARRRGVTVSIPNAEIMQSGRRGDLVRVRNPRSQQVVTGRVVSSGRVEIRL